MGGKRVVTGVRNTVTGNSPSITRHRVTVTEIVSSKVMTAAAHSVTMERVRNTMSAQCTATPPMTHVGQATMEPTMEPTAMPAAAPTVKPGAVKTTKPTGMPAPTAMPAAATAMPAAAPTAMPGNCRNVRHDAKRANRNARCQNAYYFLLHDAFPISKS